MLTCEDAAPPAVSRLPEPSKWNPELAATLVSLAAIFTTPATDETATCVDSNTLSAVDG